LFFCFFPALFFLFFFVFSSFFFLLFYRGVEFFKKIITLLLKNKWIKIAKIGTLNR